MNPLDVYFRGESIALRLLSCLSRCGPRRRRLASRSLRFRERWRRSTRPRFVCLSSYRSITSGTRSKQSSIAFGRHASVLRSFCVLPARDNRET